MSKYSMEFEIEGSPEKKLLDVESSVTKVGKAAEGMRDSLSKAGESLDTVANSAKAMTFQDLADRFGAATASMRARGEEFVKDIIHQASTFEDAQSEMRFAFGKDWQNVYDQVLKDAADLTFTFEQTSRLASSLGRMKINPFGGTTEESQVFKSKTGENIRALAVLQDTADAVGKSADDVVVSLRNAMAGSWKSLEDRFDIPRDKIKEWRKEIDKLKEPQEKYNALVGKLGEMFGGAGKEKALNYSKAMDQIPDLLQQIKAGAGAAGLKDITKGMFDLVGSLTEFVKNKDAMLALSEAFKVVAWWISTGAHALAGLVRGMGEFLKTMPWLPKVVVAVGSLVAGFIALASVVMTIAAGAASVGAAMSALGVTVGGVLSGALLLVPALVFIGGAFVTIGIAAKAAAGALTDNWGGVGSTFEKINTVFKAFIELADSYNGTTATMSTETADKLKSMGLMEFVLDVVGVFHKLHAGWEAFTDDLDAVSERLGPVVIPMIEEMGDMFLELGDALGLTNASMEAAAGTTDDYADQGHKLAETLIRMTEGLITVVRWTTAFIRVAVQVAHIREAIMLVKAGIDLTVDALRAAVGLAERFAKALGVNVDMKKALQFDGMRGSIFHDNAKPPPGTGDPFAQKARLAGGKYRDAAGNFDPLKGDVEADRLLSTGQSKEEVLAWMLESGRITKEDLLRRAKGRDSKPRAATGEDFESVYAATGGNTSKYDPNAPPEQAISAATKGLTTQAQTHLAQQETNAILKQVLEAMKSDRVANFDIDGHRLAMVAQAHRATERGNQ